MARTKRTSSVNQAEKKSKGSRNSQVIFKATWRPFNSGGKWLEFDKEREGEDLLEPLKLEDIKPNTLYYMQQVWKPYEFHPTYFDPAVSWDTIQELHKTGRLWKIKEN